MQNAPWIGIRFAAHDLGLGKVKTAVTVGVCCETMAPIWHGGVTVRQQPP